MSFSTVKIMTSSPNYIQQAQFRINPCLAYPNTCIYSLLPQWYWISCHSEHTINPGLLFYILCFLPAVLSLTFPRTSCFFIATPTVLYKQLFVLVLTGLPTMCRAPPQGHRSMSSLSCNECNKQLYKWYLQV